MSWFAFVLGVVFLILKLCHVIAWSWLWVLAPFWVPAVIWIIIGLIALWCFLSMSPVERAIHRFRRALEANK